MWGCRDVPFSPYLVPQEAVDDVRPNGLQVPRYSSPDTALQLMPPFGFFSCSLPTWIYHEGLHFVCLFVYFKHKYFLDLAYTLRLWTKAGSSCRYPVKSVEHQSLSFSLDCVGERGNRQTISCWLCISPRGSQTMTARSLSQHWWMESQSWGKLRQLFWRHWCRAHKEHLLESEEFFFQFPRALIISICSSHLPEGKCDCSGRAP